jgi:hypothetical protein
MQARLFSKKNIQKSYQSTDVLLILFQKRSTSVTSASQKTLSIPGLSKPLHWAWYVPRENLQLIDALSSLNGDIIMQERFQKSKWKNNTKDNSKKVNRNISESHQIEIGCFGTVY